MAGKYVGCHVRAETSAGSGLLTGIESARTDCSGKNTVN